MGFLTKIISLLKRSSSKGQHTVEYAILMILIMAGIMTMGRYVIRSWNANLKGWEDSVTDSMEDPLLEAPPTAIEGCEASSWIEQGCGFGLVNTCSGNIVSCAQTEMTSIRAFNPPGCQCAQSNNSTVQCATNDCCCETPTPTGLCGANMTSPAESSPPSCTNTGLSPTNPDGTCPFGSMGFSINCGDSTYYGCNPDASCLIYCLEEVLPVALDGTLGSFPKTPDGQLGESSCPIGYVADPEGPPARECQDGTWGELLDPCVLVCGDGYCDETVGETCANCPEDCGIPDPYGGYGACPDVEDRRDRPTGGGSTLENKAPIKSH